MSDVRSEFSKLLGDSIRKSSADNGRLMDQMTNFIAKLNYSEFLSIIDLLYPGERSYTDELKEKIKKEMNKYINPSLANIVANFTSIDSRDIYANMAKLFIERIYDPTWIIIYVDDIRIVKEIIKRSKDDIDIQSIEEWGTEYKQDYGKWKLLIQLLQEN